MHLHFKELGALFQPGMFRDQSGAPIKEEINKDENRQRAALKHKEQGIHPPCVKRTVGIRQSQHIKNKKHRRQRHCGMPYLRDIKIVNCPRRIPQGGSCRCNGHQTCQNKLQQRRFLGELPRPGHGMEPCVKCTRKL